jgi:hypothetical protein
VTRKVGVSQFAMPDAHPYFSFAAHRLYRETTVDVAPMLVNA